MLRVASILLGSLGLKDLALAGTGELGETVEQARKTEFFRWFHLEETGRSMGKAGTVVHFKPSADKFQPRNGEPVARFTPASDWRGTGAFALVHR